MKRIILIALTVSTLFLTLVFTNLDQNTVMAANLPPVEIYYLSLPEDDILQLFDDNYSNPTSPLRSVTSISIGMSGTWVYYDQWEDGSFDLDMANPGANVYNASTNPDGTQIWGDADLTNGCPLNINNKPNFCTSVADDTLEVGESIILDNWVTLTGSSGSYNRNASQVYFDGGDKVGVTKQVAVTRAIWPSTIGTLIADAVEVMDTSEWGTSYVAPTGENVSTSTQAFEDTRWFVMAQTGGATIDVDINGDGSIEYNDIVLAEGQNRVFDGIRTSSTLSVVSGYAVQITQLLADVGSTYENRFMTLVPRNQWSNDYYSPVGTDNSPTRHCTETWMYNPSSNPLTVNYATTTGSGTISVAARSATNSPNILNNSGIHLYTANTSDVFLPFTITDCSTGGDGAIHDWGGTLFPVSKLTSSALVGWAPGCTNESAAGICREEDNSPSYRYSRSVVWVTPLTNTTIYVDKDGTGISCPGGVGADQTISPANALASYKIVHDPSSRNNVRDEFSSSSYSLNNGSQNWSTNWTESGESTSPTSGAIQIPTYGEYTYTLRFQNNSSEAGRYIQRSRNLSGQYFARLSFQIQSQGLDSTDDIAVDITSDGSTWYTLRQYEGNMSQRTDVFDITKWISANTAVRFRIVDPFEGQEYWSIDNVNIDYAPDGDFDMTGALITTCDDNAKIAVAYGQDPARSDSGDEEALDLGMAISPFTPETPTAVVMASFNAIDMSGNVELTWETALESNALGFNLYRAASLDGERALLNPELIPSQSLGGAGAAYQFVDTDIQSGNTYYYWLEFIDLFEKSNYGPVVGATLPKIYLPVILKP
jgi:hypothetical protein